MLQPNAAATTSSSAPPAGSFSFPLHTASSTTATTNASTGGFSFGPSATGKPAVPGFGFGLAGAANSSGAGGVTSANPQPPSFSIPTAASKSGFMVPPAQNTAIAPAPVTLSAVPPLGLTIGTSLSAGVVTKSSNTAIGSQLMASSSLPATGAAAATISNVAASSSTGGVVPVTNTAVTAGGAAATSTSTSSSGSSGPKMTYKELEEQMNKWWVELEHQEKVFLEQATKVNAWDKVLIKNGQKITSLNADVDKVKLDQHRLNHELDFIVAQQKELEEMLVPLEDSVSKLPAINYQQHTDSEREHTYQIAEHIDAQLKRMTEDLKEVIDHLNTSTGSQDRTDPMLQISKILNAHMESLQWVDQNAAVLQRKTEEVARYADYTKKEHERNFRLAYS